MTVDGADSYCRRLGHGVWLHLRTTDFAGDAVPDSSLKTNRVRAPEADLVADMLADALAVDIAVNVVGDVVGGVAADADAETEGRSCDWIAVAVDTAHSAHGRAAAVGGDWKGSGSESG